MAKSSQLSSKGEPDAVGNPSAGREREAAIRASVLKDLGRPAGLFRIAVIPLWHNYFRVNVVTGEDVSSLRIPHSYFVTADDLGNILRSNPPIQKQP